MVLKVTSEVFLETLDSKLDFMAYKDRVKILSFYSDKILAATSPEEELSIIESFGDIDQITENKSSFMEDEQQAAVVVEKDGKNVVLPVRTGNNMTVTQHSSSWVTKESKGCFNYNVSCRET